MKAMAAGSLWGLKALPAVKLTWAVPLLFITALFASKSSLLHSKHSECHTQLVKLARENKEFQRRIDDGSLLASLTAASFKVEVTAGNEDILRMTPASLAKQVQQLREIAAKYHEATKRLMEDKQVLSLEKDKAVEALAKAAPAAAAANSAAESASIGKCQAELRKATRKLTSANDQLEMAKTERMAAESRIEEAKDQLKHSDELLDAATKELKASKDQLDRARAETANCKEAAPVEVASGAGAAAGVAGDRSFQGYPCEATEEDMKRYLNYIPGKACPNDWYFVQRLIFKKNCFSLPRRKCRVPTAARPADPLPLPRSLFDQGALKNRNVRWDLHQYKSFEELNARTKGDCRQCFNLSLEETLWKDPFRGTIPMKDVVEMKKGSLRLGLDVGGGTGSFAAHMARFGVTVMTTAFNVETIRGKKAGLPYMETIAARGLIPLHVPHAARLPLYDGVLDVVHSVNSIKYIPLPQFEELIYEWDRVLRVGGIFWFEMFYAPVADMPKYVAVIEQLNFKKLYWNFTPKPDKGEVGGEHVYLNCVLEKRPAAGRQILVAPPEEDMQNIV